MNPGRPDHSVDGAAGAGYAVAGPLAPLLADPEIAEIMVNAPDDIWVERRGRLAQVPVRFADADDVLATFERIVAPLGLRLDRSSPIVDARLADGSRFHAVVAPVAVAGPVGNIRRFTLGTVTLDALVRRQALSAAAADWLAAAVAARRRILVAGATASGKTTLLNALAGAVSPGERVVTIEDAAELRLAARHVVALEARPAGPEGAGAVPVRALVRAALRMRPDRLVVGEVRGDEAVDLVLAFGTGHAGMATVHAGSAAAALARLELLVLLGDGGWTPALAHRQVASSIDVVVVCGRRADGHRQVVEIVEVGGCDPHGRVRARTRFRAPGPAPAPSHAGAAVDAVAPTTWRSG